MFTPPATLSVPLARLDAKMPAGAPKPPCVPHALLVALVAF
jgi:hypothetical protein